MRPGAHAALAGHHQDRPGPPATGHRANRPRPPESYVACPGRSRCSSCARTRPRRAPRFRRPAWDRARRSPCCSPAWSSRRPTPINLDAEARHRVSARYLEACATCSRHGGTSGVRRCADGGFGVPRAARGRRPQRHTRRRGERDPQAWAIRSTGRSGPGCAAPGRHREVISARPGPERPLATGETVNAAKRLEEMAGAGETLIDDATQRLVREAQSDGAIPLAGEPWSGLPFGASAGRGALPRSHSPLVGRAQQLPATVECLGGSGGRPRMSAGDSAGGPRAWGSRAWWRSFARARRPGDGAQRPLPPLRRGHHLLAARRGRHATHRSRRRRLGRALAGGDCRRASGDRRPT